MERAPMQTKLVVWSWNETRMLLLENSDAVPCGPIFYECFEALACGADRINQGPLCYAVNVVQSQYQ